MKKVSYTESTYSASDMGDPVIYVTRRETVAIIEPSDNGQYSMVETAFLEAGKFLNREASQGLEPTRPIELEFEFRGVKFMASALLPREEGA
jgi:hypothetical protein